METRQTTPDGEGRARSVPFESVADPDAFFRACDEIAGPEREPDWEEHVAVLNKSRALGAPRT